MLFMLSATGHVPQATILIICSGAEKMRGSWHVPQCLLQAAPPEGVSTASLPINTLLQWCNAAAAQAGCTAAVPMSRPLSCLS
jgi:hypothetical protein